MRYFLLVLGFAAFGGTMNACDVPKTLLSGETCPDSGTYANDNISFEWANANSSEADSYCALTMNPYDDSRFVRFVFKESPYFLRYFFSKKKIISFRKESFFREKNILIFSELFEENFETVKVYPGKDEIQITEKELRDFFSSDVVGDFLEFVEFAQNPKIFIDMFEKYPLLYSEDDVKTSLFIMPKKRELAVFVGRQKGKKDATIYFSPPAQNDFLLWKISYRDSSLVVIEYSSRENLFWVDEDGDGLPDFCVRKQHGNWLKSRCEKRNCS